MSASLNWIAWKSRDRVAELLALARVADRGLERGLRDAERERRDPDAPAVEDAQRVDEALPSARRRRFSAGTRQSSNTSSEVSEERTPELVLLAPRRGSPACRARPRTPRCPSCRPPRSVTAITTAVSAMPPLVMKVLEPLSTQLGRRPAPRSCAVPPASEPAPGSVSPQQPTFSPRASGGRKRRFCSSLPNSVDVRRAQAVVRRERQRDAGVDARELLHHDRVVERRRAPSRRTPPASRRPPGRGRRAARTPRAGTPASRPTRASAGRARPRRSRARSCAEAAALR